MWEFRSQVLKEGTVLKFALFESDRPVSFSEAIALWRESGEFRWQFSQQMANAPFSAFFWELPPVNREAIARPCEWVLVDSPHLAKVEPNPAPFAKHWTQSKENKPAISFPNLGGDALLIVPRPGSEWAAYAHLATFIRQAPDSQIHALWQTLGEQLECRLQEQPIWVSTSGLGVHWLHLRLDSRPKYYTFGPYKPF